MIGSDTMNEDDFIYEFLQASPLTKTQQCISLPGMDLNELAKFPNTKGAFVRLNTGIQSNAPDEPVFCKGREIFLIKRGKISDDNFERQFMLSYKKFFK